MATLEKSISREEFMEVCPEVLKKRIEDFFIYYSEKKKTTPFGGTVDTSKKFHSKDKFEPRKKQNTSNFRKPFERDSNELEKFLINYKGVLSKVNENNHDAIWKELLDLELEKYITDPSVSLEAKQNSKNTSFGQSQGQKDIAKILYQYTRTCNLYLKQYIDIVNRMKKSKELSPYSIEFLMLLMNDLEHPKENDKEYNVLTHAILCECTNTNLIVKKKFITIGLQENHIKIIRNLEENEPTDELLTILIQNIKLVGKQIYKQKEVTKIIDDMIEWKNTKMFSGKLHFNLIDLLSEIEKWNS